MKRVWVNEKWCLGCHLCEFYCAFANSGGGNMAIALRELELRPRIRVEERGGVSYAVNCRHCEAHPCVKNCIAGAISCGEDGVIVIDKEKCVGCYTCVLSCPYGAVSPSEDGTVQKCELCRQRSGGVPMCVEHCPNNAIVFEEREV